jgi:hypothetical protein
MSRVSERRDWDENGRRSDILTGSSSGHDSTANLGEIIQKLTSLLEATALDAGYEWKLIMGGGNGQNTRQFVSSDDWLSECKTVDKYPTRASKSGQVALFRGRGAHGSKSLSVLFRWQDAIHA